MTHVAQYKKQLVEDLAARCAAARVVGVANIHGIPAPQFQAIRKKLSGRATITVAKNNLLRLALQQASEKKPALVKLSDTIEGQTAVVTADINPFRLFKELEATKTRAPAVRGEIAQAWREALALALEIGYPTKETIRPLLAKAHAQALGLAVESEFPTKESVKFLLAKAYAQMRALVARAPGAADEELRAMTG